MRSCGGAAERTVAVVLAGGGGQRMGGVEPKQFLVIGGRTVLERAVGAFERNGRVDEIVVVAGLDQTGRVEELARRAGWRKVGRVVAGGAERADSTLAALRALAGEAGETRLLVHDAARPGVTQGVIEAVWGALDKHEAASAALPVADTLVRARGCEVVGGVDREGLWRLQTPQGFRLGTLAEAYARWERAGRPGGATDDCGIVRLTGTAGVWLVRGDERNMKLTWPGDLEVLETLLAAGVRRERGE